MSKSKYEERELSTVERNIVWDAIINGGGHYTAWELDNILCVIGKIKFSGVSTDKEIYTRIMTGKLFIVGYDSINKEILFGHKRETYGDLILDK